MSPEQFKNLKPGDVIQHRTLCPFVFKVEENKDGEIQAEAVARSRDPGEWLLLIKKSENPNIQYP